MLALEEEILCWIDQVWSDQSLPYYHPQSIVSPPQLNQLWHQPDHALFPALTESIRRLREKWSDDDITHHAADVFFMPMIYQRTSEHWKARVLNIITYTWLLDFGLPNDLVRRVEESVVLCYTDFAERLRAVHSNPGNEAMKYIGMLDLIPDSPELFDLLERLLQGDPLVKRENGEVVLTHKALMSRQAALQNLYRLYRAGRLNSELFTATVRNDPFLMRDITSTLRYGEEYRTLQFSSVNDIPAEFFTAVKPYTDQIAEDLAADIRADNYMHLKHFHNLSESKWLLRAADLYQRSVSGILEMVKQSKHYSLSVGLDTLVIHMAQAHLPDLDTDKKRARFIDTLRVYSPETLKALLPVAKDSREVLLAALGWEDCGLLIQQMVEVSQYHAHQKPGYGSNDVPNSSDPSSGLLDVTAVRQALEQAGAQRAQEIFTLFRKASIGIPNTLTLFEALAGLNVEKVKKSIQKRNQPVVKAYGLLPLERGEDEVLERYLFLKQYIKESKRFGSERQANEQAAAEAALGNLAQVAGYGDRERLEWNMEARLAVDVVPVGRQWQVEDYSVELTLDGSDPQLVVSHNGKPLKSIPKALRQSPDYEAMQDGKNQLQEQFRRFRTVFERTMAAGDPLSLTDLHNLNRIPAARILLSRLVLCNDDLITGLYLPDEMALETLSGKIVVIDKPVRIAHPYHFFHGEELAGWQQAIVHRRIMQPFKQVFRELYLLTPAEETTRLYSNRFVGHTLDGAVASRLFQARHWEIVKRGDVPLPKRLFRQQGVEARFSFSEVGHYFSEMPVTSNRISFHRYPNDDAYRDQEKNSFPLENVPPLIFSEVMRDADLVVSVARRDGQEVISNETYQRNGELVTTLLEDLGLSGVTVEGHFAIVQGKLARYRIHLGSAVIHIDPGNYLCIVPERWGQTHEKLFLPFTDTEGSKLSEVISKIFLLLADDKIKDASILRQIKRDIS